MPPVFHVYSLQAGCPPPVLDELLARTELWKIARLYKRDREMANRILFKLGDLVPLRTYIPALHWAATDGHYQMALDLIVAGADINEKTALSMDGLTPIHLAVLARDRMMVTVILHYKPNVDIMSASGETPLHSAMKMGLRAIARLLIDETYVFNAADNNGVTTAMMAVRSGSDEIVSAMMKQGLRGTDTCGAGTLLEYALSFSSYNIYAELCRIPGPEFETPAAMYARFRASLVPAPMPTIGTEGPPTPEETEPGSESSTGAIDLAHGSQAPSIELLGTSAEIYSHI